MNNSVPFKYSSFISTFLEIPIECRKWDSMIITNYSYSNSFITKKSSMIHPYTFIALDLETTWLSPEKDTIMEIAAIRFQIESENGIFRVTNTEERSMLIDPEREIKEEIQMITGITPKMVEGREKWNSVRDRAHEFIGDSIIVGHNVFFDINMLRTHGVDLSENKVLDTFELSEIFSQDAESLNLSFLAKKYGIPWEWEHRALDDTRLSVWLFIHYLQEFSKLDATNLSIFSFWREKDTSGSISLLFEICNNSYDEKYTLSFKSAVKVLNLSEDKLSREKKIIYKSFHGWKEELNELFQELIDPQEKTLLITRSRKQSEFWKQSLEGASYRVKLIQESRRYCSINMLRTFSEKTSLKRKEIIFLMKLFFWIEKTKTWLLDELRYYGEEREFLELFRAWENEFSDFRSEYEKKWYIANIFIGDLWMEELRVNSLREYSTIILLDTAKIEDTFRQCESRTIVFMRIFSDARFLEENSLLSSAFSETLYMAISYIQNLLENIPERPTWPLVHPPGNYGETYYLDQWTIWQRWGRWLCIVLGNLERMMIKEQESFQISSHTLIDEKIFSRFLESIDLLITIGMRRNTEISMILSIQEEWTTLKSIPRNMRKSCIQWMDWYTWRLILTGYGLEGSTMQKFLWSQCGIDWIPSEMNRPWSPILEVNANVLAIPQEQSSICILSTSNKHLRTLKQDLERKFPGWKVFTQGISGGKWKVESLFLNYTWKKILIWLMDSWIDDWKIWRCIDMLIIAKMPFDPPTDPYFLAQTVGMRNNFEEYSCPLAINTVNTLIWTVRNNNPDIQVYCLDDRLEKTLWGNTIRGEIL